jgi:hypothetical protein
MRPAQTAPRPGNDGYAPVEIDHSALPSLLSASWPPTILHWQKKPRQDIHYQVREYLQ